MSAVFLKLLNMSVTASYMILAVLVLRICMKRAPKWISCLLWGLVGIRLACPVTVKSSFSLVPGGAVVSQEIAASRYRAVDPGGGAVSEAAGPVLSSALEPQTGAGAHPTDVLITAAAVVWLVGVIVMLVYALASYLKLKKTVSTAVPSREGVMVCDEIASPFLFGLIRPTIYVPAALREETLRNVIEHETAHFKRGDHLWKPLAYLLLAVYWFNPLCWVAYVLLCRDIESACDEKVIRHKNKAELAAYSQALLDCSVSEKHISACLPAFGEVGVKQRIRGVLNYKKPAGRVVLAAAVLCAVVCVCLMTDPVASAKSFAFPADVTEATVTHILEGQTEERRVRGETMQQLNAWLSGLHCKEKTFAPGKTPGDANGGETYVITASSSDGNVRYSYIKNGETDCWLLADGGWYAVQKPGDPPVAFGEAHPSAKKADDGVIPPQPATTEPDAAVPKAEKTPAASAKSVSAPAETTTAPNVPASSNTAQRQTSAAQAAEESDGQEQFDVREVIDIPLPVISLYGDGQEQIDDGDDAETVTLPVYSVGNGDFADKAVRYVFNSEEMNDDSGAEASDGYCVLENNGAGRVTVQVGNDLYTVYGEKDYTGSWRVDSYEYHAGAVQDAESGDPATEEDD
ncbi:MAG: hypothetical protein IJK89_01365 [Clostridia bacterium]|nr:hypothetical protein [Clostridia bacterium]